MTASVVRLSPTDRRSPITVEQGGCKLGAGCFCCPKSVGRHDKCRRPHPPVARECRPPYPSRIPPCPERQTLPEPPAGVRHECCVDCGRVTARLWTRPDGTVLPWCAGQLPTTPKEN